MAEMGQIRCFVALLPPTAVQTYAADVIGELSQRYRTRTSNAPPHITLQPPFLWSENSVVSLTAQLEGFANRQTAVPVHLLGYGAFAPRVLYINVVRTPELLRLQAALRDYLEAELGIVDPKAKQRPFAPHLTVASRNLTGATFRQAWAELQPRSFEFQFVAEQLTLLIYRGQRWQVQGEFPLLRLPGSIAPVL